jgi:hypothetical protein
MGVSFAVELMKNQNSSPSLTNLFYVCLGICGRCRVA